MNDLIAKYTGFFGAAGFQANGLRSIKILKFRVE